MSYPEAVSYLLDGEQGQLIERGKRQETKRKPIKGQRQQLRYLDVQLDEELALLYQSCKDYEQLIKAFNKYFTGKRKVNLLQMCIRDRYCY